MSDKLFLYSSLFAGVVPLGTALYNYAYLNSQHKWVVAKIIFHLVIVCISVFVRLNIPNFFLYYILCFGLAITIHYIFIQNFTNSSLKRYFQFSTVVYLIFLLIDAFVLSGANTYKNFSFTLFDIWAVIIIFIYLGQILKDAQIRSIKNYPMFWIALGIGVTYLGSLSHFLLAASALANNVKLFFLTQNITLTSTIIGTALQTIGFWKCRKISLNEILFKDF